MSEAVHPMRPTVSVDGRRVTVTFDMPFMAGDPCITPSHYEETFVSHGPEVGIRLHANLERIDIHCNGAWYTGSHSQLHGTNEFLPDRPAFLRYWLQVADRSRLESHLSGLRKVFANEPAALRQLQDRHVELLRTEIATAKNVMGDSIVTTTQQVLKLEASINKATGAA